MLTEFTEKKLRGRKTVIRFMEGVAQYISVASAHLWGPPPAEAIDLDEKIHIL